MNRGEAPQLDGKDELAIIQQTDVDAKLAKRSAAAFGYLDDPFIEEFVKPVERKPPIINRGFLCFWCTDERDICSDSFDRPPY